MKVKVLSSFIDKENKIIQPEGKVIEITEERFNKIMAINDELIEVTEDEIEFPKHVGGGYYELSNGEKIKGKDEALKAENELQNNE